MHELMEVEDLYDNTFYIAVNQITHIISINKGSNARVYLSNGLYADTKEDLDSLNTKYDAIINPVP
ncbi:MAG: hypothetical protein R8G66_23210 [Cytophagales bacterium]|nr:hypothetical protein [Cytophagales bacterium]